MEPFWKVAISFSIFALIVVLSWFAWRVLDRRENILFGSTSRVIARSVTVGAEWKEIPLSPPLVPEKRFQRVLVQIPDVVDWRKLEDGTQILIKKDGSEMRVLLELVDESGKTETLIPVSIGSSIGFDQVNPDGNSSFDSGRAFRTFRIRSTQPFVADVINWYCWTGK